MCCVQVQVHWPVREALTAAPPGPPPPLLAPGHCLRAGQGHLQPDPPSGQQERQRGPAAQHLLPAFAAQRGGSSLSQIQPGPPPLLASFLVKTRGVSRARNRALPGRGVCQGLSEMPSGPKFRSPSRCPQLHAKRDRRIPPAQSLALSLKREGPSHHCPPCTGPGQGVQRGLGILCGGVRGGLLDWEPWWSCLLLPLKLEPVGRTTPKSATIPLPRPAPQGPPRGHPHHGLRGLPPSHSWPRQERNPPRGLRLTQPCLPGNSQHQSPTGSRATARPCCPSTPSTFIKTPGDPAHEPPGPQSLGTPPLLPRQERVPGLQLASRRCPGSRSSQHPGRPTLPGTHSTACTCTRSCASPAEIIN